MSLSLATATQPPPPPATNSTDTTTPSRKRRSSEAVATVVTMPLSNPSPEVPKNVVSIKVRLKRFHAVAAWTWNANDHVCGICQSPFEGVCPGVKYPGEDCPVVWGKCGHAFHLQCVSKWLSQTSSKNSCPICRQEWEFGQNPVNTSPTAVTEVALPAAAAPPVGAPTLPVPVP